MKGPSRFLPFLPDYSSFFPVFPDFSPLFPDFWQFFRYQGWHSAPLDPPVATPLLITLTVLLRDYAILSRLSCEAHHLTCWHNTFH